MSVLHQWIIVKGIVVNKIEFINWWYIVVKSSLRQILALNIKKRRYILGLSQAKLAEAANIATAYVAMIELEKKFPSVDVLERIAHALQIDPPELFSKACYPSEAVKDLHRSVLTGIEQIVKNHIEEFEAKVNSGDFEAPQNEKDAQTNQKSGK
ncbi:MAG: helix-turn-helix transcriptional regulator [Treponema sp.]|nr:helix-turn-helix transcriptional regulator [Treponema sp.]